MKRLFLPLMILFFFKKKGKYEKIILKIDKVFFSRMEKKFSIIVSLEEFHMWQYMYINNHIV